ncbi:MAG: hypothetical protein AB7W47_02260 [Calditrichaceae bacterium]
MGKKNHKKQQIRKQQSEPEVEKEETTRPEVENLYKKIIRAMSWIVGFCFIMIIILPEFNSALLDKITKILFYIGIINLLVFTVIEFVSNSFKKTLSKLV